MSKKNGKEEEHRAPDTRIVKETLEVQLTDAELKASSKALAEALRGRGQLESEIETFRAQKKAEIAKLDGVISQNANLVNTEKAFRLVECEEKFDWDRGLKTRVRLDTGEIVATDKITNEERQTFFKEPAAASA